MTSRFTLAPAEQFSESSARRMLEEVVLLNSGEPFSFIDIPSYDAVLIYAGEKRPPVYDMLLSLCKISEYNKIMVLLADDSLYLTVAQGEKLLLCNVYPAKDFVTAEYFLFLALKKLQINPEISCVYSMTPLGREEIVSLCRYFKNVGILR